MIHFESDFSRAWSWKKLVYTDGTTRVERSRFCAFPKEAFTRGCGIPHATRELLLQKQKIEGHATLIAWPFSVSVFKGQMFGGAYYGYCIGKNGKEVLKIKTNSFAVLAELVYLVSNGMEITEELMEAENPLVVPVLFERDHAATQVLIDTLQAEHDRLMDLAATLHSGYAGDFSLAISRRLLNVAEEMLLLKQLTSLQPPSRTIFEKEKIRKAPKQKPKNPVAKPRKTPAKTPPTSPQDSLDNEAKPGEMPAKS